MGFIQKLLGGIFSFLGSLFGAVAKLLGLKKSEYFLEMDDAQGTQAAAPPAAKPAPAEKAAETPAPAVAAAATPAETSAAAAAPATAAAAPAPAPAAPAPKPSAPEPAKETIFAANFALQMSGQNGRRRPGPSMNYFRDMAKQVKA